MATKEATKEEPVGEVVDAAAAGPTTEGEDWADSDDEKKNSLGDLNGISSASDEKVIVKTADPSTPYVSASKFEDLSLRKELLDGIYALKWNTPSKIQAASLPLILSDTKNLIAQGHNGSGKTACFVLGMLSKINDDVEEPQALCVCPTRELARQIKEVIDMLGKFTKASVYLAVKQLDSERDAGRSGGRRGGSGKVKNHIVVGTPGKVFDLIRRRTIDAKSIKVFVLDEADNMVDMQGMGDQTIRIKKQLLPNVQTLLFSATYRDVVRRLAAKVAPNANVISIETKKLALDVIQQFYIDCKTGDGRFETLTDIYEELKIGQSIIFVQTRRSAGDLTKRLRDGGHKVSVLYGGDMAPEERDRVIDEFRDGTTRVLVTTNVLARGVDVLSVNVVINWDMPNKGRLRGVADQETYLHRIGRTGRFGRKGLAINFIYDEDSRKILEELEKFYHHKIVQVEDAEELSEKIKGL
eukprot:Plantae.Rhodophyta-Hildenbrandia_rubra.ctg17640.p1 GENE.Plantae.Rhodophyta-Hildenbrandia_rubra.ctg17640~~Plantae.Rhodophyta-Hildenbrandia_rubra.ctg17640.p1  ORF type:complete len:469 (+),score=102.18 Plantae.Rhodophyta-Hildenbrandia_rubra.ctg17640:824-2230(+)